MNKRGISPLIASVLLITFTILVFVMISSWVKKGTLEPSMEAGREKISSAIDCMSTEIEINSACFTKNVDAKYTGVKLAVDNLGDTDIVGLSIRVVGDVINIGSTVNKLSIAPFGRIINKADFDDPTKITWSKWQNMNSLDSIEVYPEISSGWCQEKMDSISSGSIEACA